MKNTNKIKSIICVLLVFSMLCVTFTGCSSKKDDDTVAEVDKKAEETIYTNRITPTPPRFTSEMLRTLKI